AAYRIPHVVADVQAVLDDVGVDSARCVGYSFGARAALSFAMAAPKRVDALVLGGGSHRHRTHVWDKLFFPDAVAVLERDGWDGFLAEWEKAKGSEIDSGTRAVFAANDPAAIVAYCRETEAMPGIPDAALRTISTPALWFAGSGDPARLADSRDAAELMPHAECHEIEGYDHGTTLAAREEILGLVRPFLKQH
ncbi:MAG: alpha/beta fold hydrolase, partial [Aldersonia sp.]|nr:alpha/beta fold hydrolase [Aldersonia sp.]